jgi:hypothetical protein
MVLFRWLSLTLIVLALMLLGADIISTLEAGSGVVVRSLDKILLLFGVDAKPWIQTTFSSTIANGFLAVLSSPGWATFGVVGVVFTLIVPGRRERREPAAAPAEH